MSAINLEVRTLAYVPEDWHTMAVSCALLSLENHCVIDHISECTCDQEVYRTNIRFYEVIKEVPKHD